MKLTEEQILTIRTLYMEGVTQQEIALQFPVKQPAISKIVRGLAYEKVARPLEPRCCIDCNVIIERGKRRCEPCNKKHQALYFQQYRRQQVARTKPIEEWLCIDCRVQVEGGTKRCQKCHDIHQGTYFIQRYKRLKVTHKEQGESPKLLRMLGMS